MEQKNNNLAIGMSVFGAIFFIFGFATTFIITLSAPVKAIFSLSEFEAQLLSSAFFIAYPLMSIPTGKIIDKMGYKWTVVAGLILMALGSFIFIPAAKLPSFPNILTGNIYFSCGCSFPAGCCQPLCNCHWPRKWRIKPAESDTSLEFSSDHDCSVVNFCGHFQRIGPSY